MVKLYFIRHGYSIGNEKGFFTGRYDCELCELGRKQAALVSDYIVKNLKIDKFYSSPLVRAIDTVKSAAEKMKMPIISDEAFIELSVGDWEGIPFEEVARIYPEDFSAWAERRAGATPTGGETWESVLKRSAGRLGELVLENDGKSLLICTHGGVIKTLQAYFAGVELTRIDEFDWVSNASVTEVWYDGGKYEIKRSGYDGYLCGLKTELPKTI